MYCSNCGNQIEPGDHYCRFCGKKLHPTASPKKGSLWIPVVLMVLLSCLGIGLFFAIPGRSGSASGVVPGNQSYGCFTVEEGVLSFDAATYNGGSELIVPGFVNGEKVIALSEGCFEGCTELTSIELPETLAAIGAGAFRDCTALRGIQIPESVNRIGAEAFYGCTALEAICLSDSLNYIGPGAFGACNQLYYIMFLGKHQDWVELYDEFVTPYTGVFCDDGSYYQGSPAS